MRRFVLVTVLVSSLAGTACDEKPANTATAAEVAKGAMAPSVSLALHDGKTLELASLKGNLVLLYFYPKDDTPG